MELLDLSEFACSIISVSFAVLSKYTKSSSEQIQFSPAVSLCVPDGKLKIMRYICPERYIVAFLYFL